MGHADDEGRWMELMAAAQKGDGGAYARLLTGIVPLVRRMARKRWRRAEDLEDIVQEVLLSLHQVRHTYDPARPFLPWLGAIVDHRVADGLRRVYRRQSRETELDERHETIAAAGAKTQGMDGRSLRRALSSLPEGQRRAVELIKLQEMSLAEASASTGVSVGALKVAVHRALKALKGAMDR